MDEQLLESREEAPASCKFLRTFCPLICAELLRLLPLVPADSLEEARREPGSRLMVNRCQSVVAVNPSEGLGNKSGAGRCHP